MTIGQNGCAGIYPAMLAVMVAPTLGINSLYPAFVIKLIIDLRPQLVEEPAGMAAVRRLFAASWPAGNSSSSQRHPALRATLSGERRFPSQAVAT